MAEPRHNALYPRQSDALVENWAAGTRPETLSAYQEPWYRALPNYLTGLVHGPDSTMAQANTMRHLAGTENPLNLPGQFSEGLDTAAQGYKLGNPTMTGAGLFGVMSSLPIPGFKGAGQAAKLAAVEREIAAKAGAGGNALLPHPQPGGLGSGQQGHMPTSFEGPPGQGVHTNSRNALLSDPFLPPHEAGSISSDQALRNAVKEAIAANDGYYYGLRITDTPLDVGKKAPNSRQWYQDFIAENDSHFGRDRFPDHNTDLGGPSTYGVTSEGALDFMLGGANGVKPYTGNHYSLIRSDKRQYGKDPGEWILPDGEVVASWQRPDGYKPATRTDVRPAVDNSAIDALERRASSLEAMGAATGAAKLRAEIASIRAASVAATEQPKGIRAYHGSPHDFDKFDLNKIGTGEGAQAYGHGLYFAESEGVAESYRSKLSTSKNLDIIANNMTSDPVARVIDRAGGDIGAAISMTEDALSKLAESNPRRKFVEQTLAELKSGKTARESVPFTNGRMYEVNIKADPEHFLDWDKPLSAQSEIVQKNLMKLPQSHKFDSDQLGALLYQSPEVVPGQFYDKKAATAEIQKAGIPGIKYLDQGSRTAGEGSRNYVVFDAATIEILRKYGLLPPMLAAGAAGAGSNALYDGTNNQ